MSIKSKTIKKSEKTQYEVIIDGHVLDTVDTKEWAKEKEKEYLKIKENRLKDFLIAEKLMDYKWTNFCNNNYLISFQNFHDKTQFRRDDEKCFKEGAEISGILWNSMSDEKWRPPEYQKDENFLSLFVRLIELGLNVLFYKSGDNMNCLIEDKLNKKNCVGTGIKKQDYWGNQYLMSLALKHATYNYCLTLS